MFIFCDDNALFDIVLEFLLRGIRHGPGGFAYGKDGHWSSKTVVFEGIPYRGIRQIGLN
jgi:hypothetical protein